MAVQQTSIDAYRDTSEWRDSMKRRVLDYLYLEPSTIREVSEAFGVFPNEISGRFTELKKSGRIREAKKRICKASPSNRRAIEWEVVISGTNAQREIF